MGFWKSLHCLKPRKSVIHQTLTYSGLESPTTNWEKHIRTDIIHQFDKKHAAFKNILHVWKRQRVSKMGEDIVKASWYFRTALLLRKVPKPRRQAVIWVCARLLYPSGVVKLRPGPACGLACSPVVRTENEGQFILRFVMCVCVILSDRKWAADRQEIDLKPVA